MSDPLFINRRNVTCGLLIAPIALAAHPAEAASPQSFSERLAKTLDDLNTSSVTAHLRVVQFETPSSSGALAATIRLDWPPGMRQRRFTSNAPDQETAFLGLKTEIETYFGALI